VTKRLQELGLDVEEIDEQHKLQAKGDGVAMEMERDLFYAVPSANSEEGPITHRRVHVVKKALQSTLRDADIQACPRCVAATPLPCDLATASCLATPLPPTHPHTPT
jgi:hypothetical protein